MNLLRLAACAALFSALAPSASLAQQTPAPAPASAPAPAPVSAAKKELVQKILQMQQPGIDQMARTLAEQTVAPLVQQGQAELQRIPEARREAVAKEMQADLRKYGEEAVPLLRERATRLAPSTVGAILEERFTEDELKQVIGLLESPVNRKFQAAGLDMQRALTEKLLAEARPALEPRLRTLRDNLAKRLGLTPPAGDAAKPAVAAPAARPASR